MGGGGGGQQRRKISLHYFFLPKNIFFDYWVEEGLIKQKTAWEWGGGGGYYIKDWFTQISPLILTSLLCKLKLIIPMVKFAPPPPLLLATLHPCRPTDRIWLLLTHIIACLHYIFFWVSCWYRSTETCSVHEYKKLVVVNIYKKRLIVKDRRNWKHD